MSVFSIICPVFVFTENDFVFTVGQNRFLAFNRELKKHETKSYMYFS